MLRILFWTFLRIAAVTPGGGLVMLPILQQEFEERRKWVSPEDMVDIVAMVQSTPGIIAVNMAVMLGYRVAGVAGALAASFGAVLPSFLIILAVAALFHTLGGSGAAEAAFAGVRAAVCALILLACVKMARKILKGWFEVVVAVASFAALVFGGANAAALIVAAALVGLARDPVKGLRRRWEAPQGQRPPGEGPQNGEGSRR